MSHVRRGRDVFVLAAAEERRQRPEKARWVAERPVGVQVEREEVLAQEDDDLRPGQHPDVRRQPQLEGVFADDPVAERVEGPDCRIGVAVRDQLVDPELHLRRGLLREGEGKDLRRLRASSRDEPGDPARDDLRLARPGTRDDEERPVAVCDRAELFRVQAAEQRIEPGRRVPAEWLRGGADEPIPDGHLLEWDRLAHGAQTGHWISQG